MYESFYRFREKPFSLLPDCGFLYLSGKHRMALTLLEYGLMNHAHPSVVEYYRSFCRRGSHFQYPPDLR